MSLKVHVLAILLTGFGNSTCFLRSLVEWFQFMVVCPLVAIMEDQVKDAV